jgi:hypothetical protein
MVSVFSKKKMEETNVSVDNNVNRFEDFWKKSLSHQQSTFGAGSKSPILNTVVKYNSVKNIKVVDQWLGFDEYGNNHSRIRMSVGDSENERILKYSPNYKLLSKIETRPTHTIGIKTADKYFDILNENKLATKELVSPLLSSPLRLKTAKLSRKKNDKKLKKKFLSKDKIDDLKKGLADFLIFN